MNFRGFIAILTAKISRLGIRVLGRTGSSTPGVLALKICPDLLSRLKMPEKTIIVTGSNGKTTTTELIYHAAVSQGLDIICNNEGSNQIEGVTAMLVKNCNLGGKVRGDIALIESDERYMQYTCKSFVPTYVVLTNLYRDQITRNGSSEYVKGEVVKGLHDESILIYNADDPVVASIANNRNGIPFGVAEAVLHDDYEEHAYNDGAYCPVCAAPMTYEYHVASHVGKFRCTACGFGRGEVKHEATAVDGDKLIIDGKFELVPQLMNMVFIYNNVAAFTTLTEAMGLSPEQAAEGLSNYRIVNNRFQDFDINGHKGLFILAKHENSMAYNGALTTAVDDPEDKTIVVIVDRLSRKHVASDMSWLWDIDFSRLKDPTFKRVILSGGFAHELAARVMVAGVDPAKITVEPDFDKMMDTLYDNPVGNIYAMTCFTDVEKFTGRLRGKND